MIPHRIAVCACLLAVAWAEDWPQWRGPHRVGASPGSAQGRKEFRAPAFGVAMTPAGGRGLLIAHVGSTGKGALTAFDAQTGAEKWIWKGDGPAYASPIVVELGGTRQVVTQS